MVDERDYDMQLHKKALELHTEAQKRDEAIRQNKRRLALENREGQL